MVSVALQSANPNPTPCKVCATPSPLYGVVDFHKSCLEAYGKRLSLAGVPVYYRRCPRCLFLFTEAFDLWPDQAFLDHIYNADYIRVDPEFADIRPANNASLIASTFEPFCSAIRLLDFGGGNGRLSELLQARGFTAETYDPFASQRQRPEERFDLVTCFEVLEHTPTPAATVAQLNQMLAPQGAILFSTLVQPQNIDSLGMSWWYIAPRNGHVSLYSTHALAHLFAAHGLRVASFSEGIHLAYRTIPAFCRQLKLPAEAA